MLSDLKTHSTNLEHCFTASMTAHSISILSELKMSSFSPYAGEKTRSPQGSYGQGKSGKVRENREGQGKVREF